MSPSHSSVIDYGRDPFWTDSMRRLAAAHTLVAWAKGETPCVECGCSVESGGFGRPCPATVSGYHRTENPDDV